MEEARNLKCMHTNDVSTSKYSIVTNKIYFDCYLCVRHLSNLWCKSVLAPSQDEDDYDMDQ
jgi:hypothetical protein